MLATLSQIVLAALIVIISIGGYQFYQRYKQNIISRKPVAAKPQTTTTPDPVNKTDEHKESDNINENQDCFNSNNPKTNLYLQIATVNWEQICTFAHTDTLICLTMICKELYELINQSEYLAHQTLSSIIQNNIDFINLMYEHCILDINDVDLNTETNPVTLPLFTPHIFKRMSLFPNTKLFQCYSRLMSYNWRLHYNVGHNSYLQLAKVHNKFTSLQFKSRNLNISEIQLFAIANKPFNKGLENKPIICPVGSNETISNIKSTIENKAGIAPTKQCLIVGGKGKKLQGSDIGKETMLQFNYKNLFIATPRKYKFIINNFNNFIGNLQKFCYYNEWKDIIFNLDFFLAGGMVLKCLLKYYSDPNESMKDLDFFACNMRLNTFQTRIETIKLKLISNGFSVIESCCVGEDNYGGSHIKNLYVNFSGFKSNALMYEKDINLKNKLIQWEYNKTCIEKEGFWTDFQFIHISKGFKPWSILHIFDLDCCQVGFDGNEVLSTYAFIQSINTQTMINYKTINKPRLYDIWMKRTIKYAQRGFQFIVNHKFNVNEERNPHCKFVITWDNCRQNALEKCFSCNQNSDMKTAFRIHSNGGFGLNNDSFGVRKQFIYDGIIGGKCVVLQIP